MRACIQRVTRASVTVDGEIVGQIGHGLLVLLGVMEDDTEAEIGFLAGKTAGLRIFEDAAGKMNLSVADVGGGILIVSQFTLAADCRKGKRPSFTAAAEPAMGEAFYEKFVAALRETGIFVQTGVFRAMMAVELVNDGPVTIWLDTKTLSTNH